MLCGGARSGVDGWRKKEELSVVAVQRKDETRTRRLVRFACFVAKQPPGPLSSASQVSVWIRSTGLDQIGLS
jgi:hypothetical protein